MGLASSGDYTVHRPFVAARQFGSDRRQSGPVAGMSRSTLMVESRCVAVSVGRTYPFPPLSSGGALVVRPWLRFHIPLIEPDVQISRIRLSDKTSYRFHS